MDLVPIGEFLLKYGHLFHGKALRGAINHPLIGGAQSGLRINLAKTGIAGGGIDLRISDGVHRLDKGLGLIVIQRDAGSLETGS